MWVLCGVSLLVGGEGRCPPLPWNTAVTVPRTVWPLLLQGANQVPSIDPACWKCGAIGSFPVPPLAWGWPQPSCGLEDSTHGRGAVAV